MHAKPDLRVVLKWEIAGSGSVIADVIPLQGTKWRTLRATVQYARKLFRTANTAQSVRLATTTFLMGLPHFRFYDTPAKTACFQSYQLRSRNRRLTTLKRVKSATSRKRNIHGGSDCTRLETFRTFYLTRTSSDATNVLVGTQSTF